MHWVPFRACCAVRKPTICIEFLLPTLIDKTLSLTGHQGQSDVWEWVVEMTHKETCLLVMIVPWSPQLVTPVSLTGKCKICARLHQTGLVSPRQNHSPSPGTCTTHNTYTPHRFTLRLVRNKISISNFTHRVNSRKIVQRLHISDPLNKHT